MNFSKTITTGIFLAFMFNTFSQDENVVFETSKEFEYHLGTPYPVIDATVKNYVSKNGNIIVFKMHREHATIQKFDGPDLNQTFAKEYRDFPKGTVYEDQIELEDYVYILFSAWDNSNDTEQLFVRKINKSTGEFDSESKRIIAVEGKVTGGDGDKFRFVLSFDQSKILVRYRKKPSTKRDKLNKDVIGLYAFSQDLTQIWGKEVEMPHTEAKMENIDYAIDKDANVFILTEVLKDNDTEKSLLYKNTNFDYEIITVQESGVSVNSSNISIDGKRITQARFFEGKTNSLLLAGFYTTHSLNSADGMFFCTIDKDGKQLDVKSAEIPDEIIKQFTSEKKQKDKSNSEEIQTDSSIENMVLRNIIIGPDNSVLFVGEKYYYFINETKNGTTFTYYYEEILIAKMSADGDLIFVKKLPKKQVGTSLNAPSRFNTLGMNMLYKIFDGESLGFRLIESSEYYYFLYFDNIKNLNLPENKSPEYHKNIGGFLTAYKVNKRTGDAKKLSILDTRNTQGYKLDQYKPIRIVELGNDEFAMESYIKKKQDIMIRVTIKE